jgi:glucose-6-phosphate 1-dehydrogenase
VFGITGDLPRVLTFRSLQRLGQRGLLDCPIVGVAVDDWTAEQPVQRARSSIVGTGERLDPEVFDRFAARLSYVQATSAMRPHTTGRRGGQGCHAPRVLPRDPTLPLLNGGEGAG